MSIAALTCAGVVTFNGNITLGNAITDSITFTGRVQSDVIPITDSAYDLGSSSLKWAEIHTDLISAQSASVSQAGLMDTAAQSFAGLKDFTEGVDVTAVDGSFYDEDDTTLLSATWGFTTPTSAFAGEVTRVGRIVTITFGVASDGTPAGSPNFVTSSIAIPAGFRPGATKQFPVRVYSNSVGSTGLLVVSAVGAISLYYSINTSTPWPNVGNSGLLDTSITYSI